MQRLIILIALIAILGGLLLSGIADTSTSIADTSTPDNEITTSASGKDDSSSASAIIAITMCGLPEG